VGLIGLFGSTGRVVAAGPDPAELVGKAISFLRPRQGRDGSWSGDREPGITALVLIAMLRNGLVTPDESIVTRGLTFLERYHGPKGGLSEAPHSVYTTSVALMAFHEANRGGRYDRLIKGGQDFLKATQIDEGEGKSRDDASYGGLGYGGGNSRPDLSNTSFFIEALRDTGDPAMVATPPQPAPGGFDSGWSPMMLFRNIATTPLVLEEGGHRYGAITDVRAMVIAPGPRRRCRGV
jgi:hypothetical protein